ncbi:uncharacterized protein FTOL_05294 [Fusarium torulosum]|uniref:Cyanovirin-N domain-containing protein n=1 Tax=Fusarium torulosum TaxID=33205 RepID=A0AAE8M8T1_9HYPO|nr:uncharacterized protein FTOL_05294 [Fusarium torulosum]
MHFILILLTLALGVFASKSTLPNPPTISTLIDANGTTDISKDPEWHANKAHGKISPRFMTGGFLDKCKDVRYYLSKADDNDSNKHGIRQGYKSSPWLVAKCPGKNGKYLCTWLELGKCLLNIDGDLQRGPNGKFHDSCTQCWLRGGGREFGCRCWAKMPSGRIKLSDAQNRLRTTTIDLNVAVAADNGYLTCHGNRGVLNYCTGRRSDDPFAKEWSCPSGQLRDCTLDDAT